MGALFAAVTAQAGDPLSFTDDFESGTLNAFWSIQQQNGAVVTPYSGQVHSGTNAVLLQGTGGGQKEVYLSHFFQNLQYGQVTIWAYDTQEYIYFGFGVRNNPTDPSYNGIGVQDWDHSAYYYSGGKSAVARSVGWHKFSINSTVSALTFSVDDQVIYSGVGGKPFNEIRFYVSGPGSGSIPVDNFSFVAAAEPSPIQITSLNGNGQLTWTNHPAFSNGLFSVEWSSTLGTNWHDSWRSLKSLPGNGSGNSVVVPMFYRVKCVTNLFIPWNVGAQLNFQVTNAAGSNWVDQIKVLDIVKPSAGNGHGYALLENIEGGTMKLQLMRSTDSSVYRLDSMTLNDNQEFLLGPVGTTWTNFNYEGQFTCKVTIDAIETVIVPAGTFANCYKFHKQVLNAAPGEIAEWYEWICPGFGMVKGLDYWINPALNPPITHQLQAWSLQSEL